MSCDLSITVWCALAQANLMPDLAAALWPHLEVVAGKYGLRLGSPSAAGCGAE